MTQGLIADNGFFPGEKGFAIVRGPAKITFAGSFGSAAVELQEAVNGEFVPMLDGATVISYVSDNSQEYNIHSGDVIRFEVTGAVQPTTQIRYKVTSN